MMRSAALPASMLPMSLSMRRTRAPPIVAIPSASRAVRAPAPNRTRCSSVARRTSPMNELVSLLALPSTPMPMRIAVSFIADTGAIPEPSRMLLAGQ